MATISQRLQKWFSQPQDIVGLAGFIGTSAGAIAQYTTTHSVTMPVLIGGITASLIAIVIPNGSALGSDVEKLAVDTGSAIGSKSPATIGQVITDAGQLVKDASATTGDMK